MKLSCEFNFDAAHRLAHYEGEHPNKRVHGHSFRARVSVGGSPDANGQIVALEVLQKHLRELQTKLDHTMLNEIAGLEVPTLENISRFVWRELAPLLPQLVAVEIFRDSLGQSCIYEGDDE